uniref:Uncharacterized protein n=1 Tax=Oryza sativa subsp. japonica TaxID=39947 RepID=Q6ER36_ORYSJ|nr:hypothetical protein [Oryza sativa Japonica Group]BAD28884.1 hypothetical protein [Oryza sativa Japonica Group]
MEGLTAGDDKARRLPYLRRNGKRWHRAREQHDAAADEDGEGDVEQDEELAQHRGGQVRSGGASVARTWPSSAPWRRRRCRAAAAAGGGGRRASSATALLLLAVVVGHRSALATVAAATLAAVAVAVGVATA